LFALALFLPFPDCVRNVCQSTGAAGWGTIPSPVENHSIDGRRTGWTGARSAFQPFALLSGIATGFLPALNTDRIAWENGESLPSRSAGVHLSRAPPASLSL